MLEKEVARLKYGENHDYYGNPTVPEKEAKSVPEEWKHFK